MEKTMWLGLRGSISQTEPTSHNPLVLPFQGGGDRAVRSFRVKLEEVGYIESAPQQRGWVFLSREDILRLSWSPRAGGQSAHPFPPSAHVEA